MSAGEESNFTWRSFYAAKVSTKQKHQKRRRNFEKRNEIRDISGKFFQFDTLGIRLEHAKLIVN